MTYKRKPLFCYEIQARFSARCVLEELWREAQGQGFRKQLVEQGRKALETAEAALGTERTARLLMEEQERFACQHPGYVPFEGLSDVL